MALTDADYAAAAKAAGGTGAPFAPAAGAVTMPWDPGFATLNQRPPAATPDLGLDGEAALHALQAGGAPPVLATTNPAPPRPTSVATAPPPADVDPQAAAAAAAAATAKPQPTVFARPTVVPAGFDDRNIPIRKETRAAQEEAIKRVGDAENYAAATQAAASAERADYLAGVHEQMQTRQAERDQRYARRNAEIDAQQTKLQTAMADAKNATMSKESFLERHPGSILMAIGATLGGILSARTGQPNDSMQALDAAIARDIALQKDDIARKQQNVANEQNLVGMMRNRFGDEREADIAAELQHRNTVATMLDRLGAKAKSEEQAAGIEAMKAHNAGKIVDLHAAWDQAAHHKAYALGGAGGAGASGDNKADAGLFQTEDGRTLYMPPEQAKALQEEQVSVKTVEGMTNRINALRDMPAAYVPFTKENAELKELGASFVDQVRLLGKSGTLDTGFVNQAIERFGDPSSPVSRFGQRVGAFAARARAAHDNRIKASAGEQVQRGYVQNARGELAPAKRYVGASVKPTARKTVKREEIK